MKSYRLYSPGIASPQTRMRAEPTDRSTRPHLRRADTSRCALRQSTSRGLGGKGPHDDIARGVAQGNEPEAGRNVAPPFVLDAGRSGPVEHVSAPLRIGARIRVGA